jgi:hypothetical protein
MRAAAWLLMAFADTRVLATQPSTRWTISAAPTLRIGGDEDARHLLAVVVGATRLPDGGFLVGDRSDHGLSFYDARGAYVRSVGRKGSGPGELAYLARLWRCGDSLYTHDIENGHRISVFTLDGRYTRAFRFSAPDAGGQPYQSACNADGVFGHLGWERRSDMRAGVFRSMVPLWLSRADSGVRVVLDSVPGSERWGAVRDGKPAGTGPLPLGKQPVLGVGRNRVYVGSADRYALQVFDLQGKRLAPLVKEEPPRPRTSADLEALIDAQTAGRSAEVRARVAQGYGAMDLPKTLPAYTALTVDALDHVWVRAYARPNAGTAVWSVFTPTGALVAEVWLPAGLEVFEIGRDYVLGRLVDVDAGTPEVHVYRLTRGQAR